MVDRINLILKAKNLTSRQFAEEIGIQPSGMSHILSGRNRPSLDFVMKVVNRYPEIDIKWLTLGEGEMYVSPYSMPVANDASASRTALSRQASQPSAQPSPETPASSQPSAQDQEPQQQAELDLFTMTELNEKSEPPMRKPVLEIDNNADSLVEERDAEPALRTEPKVAPVAPPVKDVAPMETKLDENRINDLPSPVDAENRNLKRKRIVKVVILYDDHSFSEYYPE